DRPHVTPPQSLQSLSQPSSSPPRLRHATDRPALACHPSLYLTQLRAEHPASDRRYSHHLAILHDQAKYGVAKHYTIEHRFTSAPLERQPFSAKPRSAASSSYNAALSAKQACNRSASAHVSQ